MSNDDPENMSRIQIAEIVRSGQLTETERRKYVTTYQEKLARPFACFVFILDRHPFRLALDPVERQHELRFWPLPGNRLRLLRRDDGLLVCSRSVHRAGGALGVDSEHNLYGDRAHAVATRAAQYVNFVEIIRGIGNLAFVMAIAGAVAYVGDRVGHQVGRRRLTLFGIRPRYTSTIIAIATGMIIALVVSLAAIFASEQVKTAFFKLNSINQQIAELQARQRDLEAKVNTGRLVLPVDTLMVPFYRIIPQSASASRRLATIRDYYFFAVKYVNANYPRLGLKSYAIPTDADKRLKGLSTDLTTAAQLSQANVMLTVTSDQNLFENDQIHFAINVTADIRYFQKGQVIAQLVIPGRSGASINIALIQLENYVTVTARRLRLPPFLSDVQPIQLIPDAQQMQQRLSKSGTYLLTAFAAEDFYPHVGGIPIVIVLTQQP